MPARTARGINGNQQVGWGTPIGRNELALLWTLNFSDGEHSLLDIAERSGMSFAAIREAADALLEVGLLREIQEET